MTPAISVTGLTRHYRGQLALDNVSFDIEPGSITGLLGRNGAGKTTLMRILAGHEFASAGTVTILRCQPGQGRDAAAPDGVRPRGPALPGKRRPAFKVRHALRAASWFYPDWDASLAEALLAEFNLPTDRAVRGLSRGMRSALGIVIGLAARAEVTLFDEPYAGLDPVARQLFYDRLLADYAAHPRTIVLSTHLIDESAGLLERVVVIDRGRVMLDAAADDGARQRDKRQRSRDRGGGVHRRADGLGPAADRRAGISGGGRPAGRHRPRPGPRAAPAPGTPDACSRQSCTQSASPGHSRRKDKRMNYRTWVKVARVHLVDRFSYTATALDHPGPGLRGGAGRRHPR